MPGEHGGLVTLGGSALVALIAAPMRSVALAAALCYVIAYLARGPVERWNRRSRLRQWDRQAMVAYALTGLACTAWVAHTNAAIGGVLLASAAAITVIGALVSRARVHREFVTELFGMGACGGSAGVSLYAGGVGLLGAAVAGLAMAGYAVASVAMVRAEVRKLEPAARRFLSWLGVAVLALFGAAAIAALPDMLLAFAPRVTHGLARSILGIGSHRIAVIATRESAELAGFSVLVGLILTGVIDIW